MPTKTIAKHTQQIAAPCFSWRWLFLARNGVSYRGRRLFPSEQRAREAYENARADRAVCFIVENGPVKRVMSLQDGGRTNTGLYKDDVAMFIPIAETP
jgi:hypothetical protein